MKNVLITLAFIFALLFLVGIISEPIDTKTYYGRVNWSLYSPEVKERILLNIKNGNCSALQIDFDTAYNNSDQQYRRTGTRNADLMAFIDESAKEIGCYR